MAQARPLLHAFNRGEVATAALARVDQEKMRLAAQVQENLLPYVIGKALHRPATQYLGATKSNNQARFLPFVRSLDVTALLEMTDGVLRVWVGDELITRASVTSSVTNGDFADATGWTLSASGGATADINTTVSGALYLAAPYRGGEAVCSRSVTTSDAGTRHALDIEVTRGPVIFRCGSTDGGDDYIRETTLDTGTHSLAFTPSAATYYVQFSTKRETAVIVDSIQVASAGVLELSAPWTQLQLREIRYDQSVDVVYLAHEDWQSRKIERRGDNSWSLVLYQPEDGPFTLSRTSNVRLKPGATRGNTTLEADGEFFRSEHVGALFRLEHDRFDADFGLAGADEYTDGIRVTGVLTDNAFDVTRSSTWVGTLMLQRSYDGRESGFIAPSTSTLEAGAVAWTTTGTQTVDPSSGLNNVIHYYRVGFETTGYTSGTAVVRLTYDGDAGAGVCRVTSTSTTANIVNVEVLADFKNTTYTKNWQEGEWSDNRGWPTAVTRHDGRLWWAGEDKFWASESDNYTAFNLDTEGDSGSIQRFIATGGSVAHCAWMLPLQRLIFGTEASEVSARASNFDTPLTPTDITLRDAATVGVAKISPVRVDKQGLYVDASETSIQKLFYDFNSLDYEALPVADLNEDYGGGGLVALAVQRAYRQPYIWAVRADGECTVILYRPIQEIEGVTRVISDGAAGEIEDVVVLRARGEDRVYFSVKRTIDGNTVRYLEKMCLHTEAQGAAVTKMADCGIFDAGPVSTLVAAHLANETGLIGWATDSEGKQVVLSGLSADGSGNIALGASYTNVWGGLSYQGRYQSAKLAYGSPGGTSLLQKKNISQVGLLLENVHRDAIKVGPSFAALKNYPIRSDSGANLADNEAVKAVHDAATIPFNGQWNTDARVCITIEPGHPATLLGLVIDMETHEK